jgi:tripeptidyl-peptidase-1
LPAGAENLPADVQECGINITPPCWKALYKLPKVNPPAIPGNSLGLFEQGDYIAVSDVQSYLTTYAPYVPLDHLPIPALIDGAAYSFPANNTLYVGGEANIDVDIARVHLIPLFINQALI